MLRADVKAVLPPCLKSEEPFAGDWREGKDADTQEPRSLPLCLIAVNWVESKTLGAQVAVAVNQFGNNDDYKV